VTLSADVFVALGDFIEHVVLDVPTAAVVAVLGPNGSGKSTLLRALSGIQPLTAGRIVLDGLVLDDPDTGTMVPPEHRPCSLVFQDYLLFPHMTAQNNVAFGLRNRGTAKAEAARQALQWLDRMGVSEFASKRPGQLSGGQAQRVALARALAMNPQLLLLDEPMAALDVGQRGSVRHELRRHLQAFAGTCLMVTHDPLDAAALATHLVIIEDGLVVQQGSLSAITTRPRSTYVAELAGVNLLRGRKTGPVFLVDGKVELETVAPVNGEALAVIAPRDVALYLDQPEGSPRNTWRTSVTEIHLLGDRVRIALGNPLAITAEITTASLSDMQLTEGTPVWASVKATQIDVYPDNGP
jgi:molybdate transport system ATP-binding protein